MYSFTTLKKNWSFQTESRILEYLASATVDLTISQYFSDSTDVWFFDIIK